MLDTKRVLAALVCSALLPTSAASHPPSSDDLRKARQATKEFRDIEAAGMFAMWNPNVKCP
jgi:hypothetical protein